ncbi:MAG: FMN-binding protein [Acidobacteria bacterium]|nr:FMN-binding protein [Acidobacteriota bacterium]
MRIPILALLLAGVVVVESQSPFDPLLQEQLGRLFPKAASFSPKEGSPPHFKAFAANGDIVGFAFWTTELEPLERGYDGPIQVLVGVDLDAELTGIIVARHHEPYGYFSIDTPEYATQFVRKSVRDRFRVGADIDSVATATITVRSATRAVRNGARRIARQFLSPEGGLR